MLRYNLTMVALAGMAMAAALPRYQADAQSGQSLVFAELACLEYTVPPHTAPFESCVERAARAFDRGQPDLAWMQARLTRDAGQACRRQRRSGAQRGLWPLRGGRAGPPNETLSRRKQWWAPPPAA